MATRNPKLAREATVHSNFILLFVLVVTLLRPCLTAKVRRTYENMHSCASKRDATAATYLLANVRRAQKIRTLRRD